MAKPKYVMVGGHRINARKTAGQIADQINRIAERENHQTTEKIANGEYSDGRSGTIRAFNDWVSQSGPSTVLNLQMDDNGNLRGNRGKKFDKSKSAFLSKDDPRYDQAKGGVQAVNPNATFGAKAGSAG